MLARFVWRAFGMRTLPACSPHHAACGALASVVGVQATPGPSQTPIAASSTSSSSKRGLCSARARSQAREEGGEGDAGDLLKLARAGLKGALKSTRRRIAKLEQRQAEATSPHNPAARWRREADLLGKAPPELWAPGMAEVELEDWSGLAAEGGEGGEKAPVVVVVKLDPAKDFAENAKELHKRFRRAAKEYDDIAPALQEARNELESWEQQRARVDAIATNATPPDQCVPELRALVATLRERNFLPKPPATTAAAGARRPFGPQIDVLRSPTGHTVLVGRSAEANERVSFELTGKDNWWFHVGGHAGAHVVIQCPSAEATEQDVAFAASVAAYHSKAKGQRSVAVSQCKGAQLARPPRFMAKTGLVILTGRVRTVRVSAESHPSSL